MSRQHNHGLKKVCGCPRRTWAKCRHPWHFSFQWKGERHRLSLDWHVGRPLTTKGAAGEVADQVRTAIRAGDFPAPPQPTQPQTADALTLDAFAAVFLERPSVRQKASWRSDRSTLKWVTRFVLPGGTRFGEKSIGAVTEDDIEMCLHALKDLGRAASTRNKYLQMFLSMSKWGQRKGYLSRPWVSPFTDLKREKQAQRSRRLQPDEEARLLQVATPGLYRLVVAALENGCRQGELLSLRWKHIDLERNEFTVTAENAKSRTTRHIPISRRLRAVLEMARHDPAGHPHGPDAYAFGDAVGRRVASPQKAWQVCVLKAHGHVPVWDRRNGLSPASQAAYQAVGLRFHDLRHEAGSRWLEAGMPLHHVKALLGHTSIATTDTYLNAGRIDPASIRRAPLPYAVMSMDSASTGVL